MIEAIPIEIEQEPLVHSGRTNSRIPTFTRRSGGALAALFLVFLGAILGMTSHQVSLTEPTSRNLSTLENVFVAEDPLDLQDFIDSQILQGEHHIIIPPGRHYVEPKHNNGKVHLSLTNLQDIVIDGMDKAEIVCTKTSRAITLFNCKNVTLKGLVIDYDPLPYTQGEIIAISDDKLTLTVSMIRGYPKADTINAAKKIEIFDSTTHELATLTYHGVTVNMQDENGSTVIVTKKPRYAELSEEKVGDVVVFHSENIENPIPHAVFSQESTDLTFEGVKLYASNTFGFLEYACSNSGYINCSVDRRLPEDDLQTRGFRRLRSTNADAFHSKHAAIGPTFKGLIARYNGDDGIAVNGHYHLISKISDGPSNLIRVVGKNGQVPNLAEGDEVELVKYSGERVPNARIVSFDPQSTVALEAAERDFLNQQKFSGSTQLTNFVEEVYIVTLDREIDLPMGSVIASTNRIGNGFRVENCIVGPNRARGLLLKAGEGIVLGNTIRDVWLSAIMLAPEYDWLEAGSGNNIFVSHNTIERSHDVAIQVSAKGGDKSVAPAGAHTGIMLADNKISGSSMPAIAVTSTNGLFLLRNSITNPDKHIVPFWKRLEFGRQEDPERQIYLQNIGSVTRAGAPDGSFVGTQSVAP